MKRLFLTALFFIFAEPAFSSVAWLNANTMTLGASSPYTVAESVTAGGTNTAAFVCVAYDDSSNLSVTSVTYGGNTMISAGAAADNTTANGFAAIYYLANPPTGSNNLVVTVSGTINDLYVNLIAYTGVNQANPVRQGTYTTTTANGSASTNITISSNVSDLTMSCISTVNQLNSTNQTSDGIDNDGGYSAGSDHATTAASSVTSTWSSNATDVAIAGLSINGSSNGIIINHAKINKAKLGF